MNDNDNSKLISPLSSSKNGSLNFDDSLSGNFLSPFIDNKVSRKTSDDFTAKNSLKHYKNNNNFRDIIFKSEKVRKYSATEVTKREELEIINEDEIDKKDLLKIRNRVSAKRSRAKKKEYIKLLENMLSKTKREVEHQKALSKNTSVLDSLMDTLVKTEHDYTKFSLQTDVSNTAKQDYYKVQTKLLHELFKKMMRCLLPINFKSFDNKMPNLKDVTTFESFDELFEMIIHNQMILKEHIQIIGLDSANVSFLLKQFYFMEQLKQFAVKFRELVGEVKKLAV